jgi:hypothetical protein
VGDCSNIRFMHAMWCGDQVLKEAFLDLYCIARIKDTSMADHLELSSGSHQWNVHFIRAARD